MPDLPADDTAYLLSSPENARRLGEAIAELDGRVPELTWAEAKRLAAKRVRRCKRPLVGVMREEGQLCSLPAERFSPACRYHPTREERNAQLLAEAAWEAGKQEAG